MTPSANIEALAQQVLDGRITPEQLSPFIAEAGLTEIPAAVWDEINGQLNHAPRRACALASLVWEIACRGDQPRPRAEANLLYIRTLNRLGEFREALARCDEAAREFAELGDAEGIARVWLEGAWAETYRGELDAARAALERAKLFFSGFSAFTKEALEVGFKWIQARILRDQGDYAEAVRLFLAARESLQAAGETLDAARVTRELGHTYSRTDPARALPVLDTARRIFEEAQCPTEAAHCDFFSGQANDYLDRYPSALTCFSNARLTFAENGLRLFAACCDLDLGILKWRLNQFEEALVLLHAARESFVQAGAASEVSSCDINLALVLIELNRYDEALIRLQDALHLAVATGRRKKAAICSENIGLAYDKQGHYAQALRYFWQAREEFAKEHMVERLVACDLYLGQTYSNLGQYGEALEMLERARGIATSKQLSSHLAECELARARILLALQRVEEAQTALHLARDLFAQTQQEVYAAFCDRLLARVKVQDEAGALQLLAQSRSVFIQHGQLVDAALCDLARGELRLEWRAWEEARADFEQALGVVHPGFPDQAWRAEYGLGRVAQAQKHKQKALHHQLTAVRTIANLRAGLGLEQLSDDLFGARQHVFTDALALAQSARKQATAVTIIEAAKAQTFLSYLAQRDWRTHTQAPDDPALPDLRQRERSLRYKLAQLRAQLSLQAMPLEAEPWRGQVSATLSAEWLRELNALNAEYESVAARLRLAQRGLAGVPNLEPFALDAFRVMAQARWGAKWAALDYYLVDGRLTIAYLDARSVKVEARTLSGYDRLILQQCTSRQRDSRELVYRGTLRNRLAPESGRRYLQHLAALLLPDCIREKDLTLVLAPHGILHQLPFHALMEGNEYLLERFNLVYTPSLQALTQLHQDTARRLAVTRLLLCGTDEFGGRAGPLHYTAQEIEAVRTQADRRATVLWKEQATRQHLLEWNKAEELAGFDLIHFATHAVVEPHTPHRSRILLADDDLTLLDILELKLNAQVVTLSTCASATGEVGHGDEMLGLARAFFYAGARVLVASLWAVEDESTAQLMTAFYRNLSTADSIAEALRAAQLEMRRNGFTPFHWAPFVAMGAA